MQRLLDAQDVKTKDCWGHNPKQTVYPTHPFKAQGTLRKRRPFSKHNMAITILNSQQLCLLKLGPHMLDPQLWWEQVVVGFYLWMLNLRTNRFCEGQRHSISTVPTGESSKVQTQDQAEGPIKFHETHTKIIMNIRILERYFYGRRGLPWAGEKSGRGGRVSRMCYMHMWDYQEQVLLIINDT